MDATPWVAGGFALLVLVSILGTLAWEKNSRGYGPNLAEILPPPPKGYFYRVRYLRSDGAHRIQMELVRRRLIFTRVVDKDSCYISTDSNARNLQNTYRNLTQLAEDLSRTINERVANAQRATQLATAALS